jgi:hypothetical protein
MRLSPPPIRFPAMPRLASALLDPHNSFRNVNQKNDRQIFLTQLHNESRSHLGRAQRQSFSLTSSGHHFFLALATGSPAQTRHDTVGPGQIFFMQSVFPEAGPGPDTAHPELCKEHSTALPPFDVCYVVLGF